MESLVRPKQKIKSCSLFSHFKEIRSSKTHEKDNRKKNEGLTGLHGGVSLRDVPRHRGEQSDTVLGRGDSVRRGRVDDEAPALGGGVEIHIVDPHPGPAHHLETTPRGIEHLPRHLRPAPHDQRVTERDLGAEILGREVIRAVHVGELPEQRQPGLPELLGHQNGGPCRRLDPESPGRAPRVGRRDLGAGGEAEAEAEVEAEEGGSGAGRAKADGGGGERGEREVVRRGSREVEEGFAGGGDGGHGVERFDEGEEEKLLRRAFLVASEEVMRRTARL
ncbi:hypothetical protein MUK42_35645 [Musa troglodytarum]|uniref:Uncharacterized protein n=1 Tax=Musa troglodytarum TaxID=320322 RepID=A0A9E7HTY6_9LILI|nr:hypothetical protein MUK42_35645 [Musa troglodytarum]